MFFNFKSLCLSFLIIINQSVGPFWSYTCQPASSLWEIRRPPVGPPVVPKNPPVSDQPGAGPPFPATGSRVKSHSWRRRNTPSPNRCTARPLGWAPPPCQPWWLVAGLVGEWVGEAAAGWPVLDCWRLMNFMNSSRIRWISEPKRLKKIDKATNCELCSDFFAACHCLAVVETRASCEVVSPIIDAGCQSDVFLQHYCWLGCWYLGLTHVNSVGDKKTSLVVGASYKWVCAKP